MEQIYKFGTVEVRPAERQILVEGRPAPVGARAFDLLLALIDARDRVVTKDELLDRVWPGVVVEENNLQVQVSTLRKVLGNRSIATLPGRGYRFTLAVEGEEEAGPSCALPGFRHNLPAQLNSFVGREREIAEVKQALMNARLVTLTGSGGTGKTRLSLRVASELAGDYRDGVWLVELAPIADEQRVPQVVAFVLGVKEEAGRPVVDALLKFVRNKSLLVILDNCEHVVSACADVAKQLLAASPTLKILASSREPLHVPGEARYPVPALSVPSVRPGFVEGDAVDEIGALRQCEAVRLFVDRARAVRPAFQLTLDNASAVASICHRLDGIPLAIELAAARVGTLPVERIAVLLNDCFRVLTQGDRSTSRQQTLRASIDWSIDLLEIPERILLRRLAVFTGGWALEAAEAIPLGGEIAGPDVMNLLTQLVEKSLVEIDARGERYRLLETVRQYALELLRASGEIYEVQMRHALYFVAFVDRTKRESAGPRPAIWLAQMDTDLENLLAAQAACDHLQGGADLGLRLSRAMRHYWIRGGHMSLGLQVGVKVLSRMPPAQRTADRARALFDVGQLNYFTGNFAQAKRYLEECLAIGRETGDKQRTEYALQPLGMACIGIGDLEAGRKHLEEAVAISTELNDRNELAAALNSLAQFHRMQGALDVAEPLYQRVLTLATQMGNKETVAIALMNLAMLWIDRRAPERARALLIQVFALEQETGSRAGAQSFIEITAGLAALREEWKLTARFFGAAEAMAADTGLHRDPADEAFLMPRVDEARRNLGEDAFAIDEAEGRALPREQMLEDARAWLEEAAATR